MSDLITAEEAQKRLDGMEDIKNSAAYRSGYADALLFATKALQDRHAPAARQD